MTSKISHDTINNNKRMPLIYLGNARVFVDRGFHKHCVAVYCRAYTIDCKSVVTDFGGSNPPSPTNSEIPAAVPFPASPKTALWREFLRLQPRTALLGPRLSFFTGDGRRGDTGRWNYKKLGGEFKIAHMFYYVKGDFTRFL